MLCEYCGSQVPDGNKFCPNCGGQMSAASAQTTPQVQTPTPTYQPYQQATSTTPDMNAANMPSKGAAIALIVVGFLCGIIWGVIGIVMYTGMSTAMAAGDAATASAKFRNIVIATVIGIVLNVVLIFSGVLAG